VKPVASPSTTTTGATHDPARGLALVGYRGTGKSTVGRLLASTLGRPFRDADQEFEERVGQTVRTFFEERGETAFRDEEEAVLQDMVRIPGVVLATGGGVVLREPNRGLLRKVGTVVWLTAGPEVLAERLRRDPRQERPALTGAGLFDEITSVLESRAPLYRAVADLVIDTMERTPEEVCRAILEGRRT
jgi:shikimate kinase